MSSLKKDIETFKEFQKKGDDEAVFTQDEAMRVNPEGHYRGQIAMDEPEKKLQADPEKQRAVVVGINYQNTASELTSCIQDAENIVSYLLENGFRKDQIKLLTDNTNPQPTSENMTDALKWLVADVKEDDGYALWFSYSGHGSQVVDLSGTEPDCMMETFIPLDFCESGMLYDRDVFNIIIKEIPKGNKITMVIDACNSGSIMNLPYRYLTAPHPVGWCDHINPNYQYVDAVLISGCEDGAYSIDLGNGGALTTSVLEVLKDDPHMQFDQLIVALNKWMEDKDLTQRPVLTSNLAFQPDRKWDLQNIIIKDNPSHGQIMRVNFNTPRPNQRVLKVLEGMMKDVEAKREQKRKQAQGMLGE